MRRRWIGLAAVVLGGLIVAGVWRSRSAAIALAASGTALKPIIAERVALPPDPSAFIAGPSPVLTARAVDAADCSRQGDTAARDEGSDAGSAAADAAVDGVRREVIARLVRSADPARAAAGLFLASRHERFDAMRDCTDDASCAAAASQPGPAVDRLAALARRSGSAPAYALALQACGPTATQPAASGFCGSLSAERWAQLAPQSAWPWLRLAEEARTRADVSGVEYAMNHAAQAEDWRAVGAGFAAMVIDALPADLPAVPRFEITGELLNAEYSMVGALQGLVAYCPADAQPGRRQSCLRLAERMLDGTDNLLGLKIAIRLGERSGVPEARLAGLRDEVESLLRLGPMAALMAASGPSSSNCAGIVQATVSFDRQSRIGELALLRERRAERGSR